MLHVVSGGFKTSCEIAFTEIALPVFCLLPIRIRSLLLLLWQLQCVSPAKWHAFNYEDIDEPNLCFEDTSISSQYSWQLSLIISISECHELPCDHTLYPPLASSLLPLLHFTTVHVMFQPVLPTSNKSALLFVSTCFFFFFFYILWIL